MTTGWGWRIARHIALAEVLGDVAVEEAVVALLSSSRPEFEDEMDAMVALLQAVRDSSIEPVATLERERSVWAANTVFDAVDGETDWSFLQDSMAVLEELDPDDLSGCLSALADQQRGLALDIASELPTESGSYPDYNTVAEVVEVVES